jgi:hypothetical protein
MLVIILRQLPHQLYNYTVVYSQAYRQTVYKCVVP